MYVNFKQWKGAKYGKTINYKQYKKLISLMKNILEVIRKREY